MSFSMKNNKGRKALAMNFDQNFLFKYRIIFHILFWIMLIVYEGLVWGSIDGEYIQRLISSLVETPVKIMATYFTLFYLIDKFLLKKRYREFILYMFFSMIGFAILLRFVAFKIIYPLFCPECLWISFFFIPKLLIYVFAIYSVVAILASFHLIRAWYLHQQATQKLEQAAQSLEKEKLAAELKLLKSQINPHFLFNTLNNLYALTLKKSGKSPEIVYKLSQLMSYMLYDSNQQEVPLSKEIDYIKNYIALEKIRYDERLEVSLNVYEGLEGIKIAPLLLLAFIENCFKHGVNQHLNKAYVTIDILKSQSQLIIKIENNKGRDLSPSGTLSGIGLTNVKKRLDLIYKDRYNLEIFNEEDTYLVVLKLQLEPDHHLINV